MKTIKVGTVLVAKPSHPERLRGGNGIAVVIRDIYDSNGVVITNDELATGFLGIEWLDSKVNPYCPEDIAAIQWMDKWFDIIDDDVKDQYLPKDWKSKGIVEGMLNALRQLDTE